MDLGSPQKILLIRADCIGDMLVTTPSIRAIRKKYPHAQIDVVCTKQQAIALENSPHLNTVYKFNKKNYLSIFKTILQLRKETYDVAINYHGGSRTASIIIKFVKSAIRVCFGTPKVKSKNLIAVNPPIADQAIYLYQYMLDELDIPADSYHMEYFLPDTIKKIPKLNNMYRFAIFIGNAQKPRECWQTEKFAELTKYLLTHDNIEIYIIGGTTEQPFLHVFDTLKVSPNVHFFINKPFAEVASLFTSCDALISGSSGLAHLAAAMNTSVLSLLYKKSAIFWRTLGEKDMYVLPEDPRGDMRGLERNLADAVACSLRVPSTSVERVIQMVDAFMVREGITNNSNE